jgi:hypothetical protein
MYDCVNTIHIVIKNSKNIITDANLCIQAAQPAVLCDAKFHSPIVCPSRTTLCKHPASPILFVFRSGGGPGVDIGGNPPTHNTSPGPTSNLPKPDVEEFVTGVPLSREEPSGRTCGLTESFAMLLLLQRNMLF